MERPTLEGCDAKLERARTHLQALYDEVNAYVASEPHEIVPEFDAEAREYWATFKVKVEPDWLRWGILLGDFIHNLRSALDHLVWQLVLLSGNKPGRDNQFPISLSGPNYWCAKKDGSPSTRDRCLKGVAEEHRTPIDEVQPYRGGYPVAWHAYAVVAWLSNTDKHQLIHPTWAATEEFDPANLTLTSSGGEGFADITWHSGTLKDGTEIVRARYITDTPETKVKMHTDIPVFIAFGHRPKIGGIRAENLGDLLVAVRNLVGEFRPKFAPA